MNEQHCGSEIGHTHTHMHEHGHHHHCISWGAILTGAFVGIGLSFLLNLFSVAIGLSVFSTSQEGLMSLAIGGFIGLLIGVIASTFVAGFVSGYLGRVCCGRHNLGVIYGFTAWCIMLILAILLATHMGKYVADYTQSVSHSTNINVTTDENAPMVSGSTNTHNTNMTVNAEKTANTMGMGAFIIFVLFFVGALSSCFGGHFGMWCRDDKCHT